MSILILGDGYVGRTIFDYLTPRREVVIHSREGLDYHNQSVLRKYIINNDIKYTKSISTGPTYDGETFSEGGN